MDYLKKVIEAVNEACIIRVDDVDWCTICDFTQMPFFAQYDSHTQGRRHKQNVSRQIQLVADYIFSVGVYFQDGKIYCQLCSSTHNSISGARHHVEHSRNHGRNVEDQYARGYGLYEYVTENEDDEIIRPVNEACVFVADDDKEDLLRCHLCSNFAILPGPSQFDSHANSTGHLDMLEEQLLEAVSLLQLPGIILDGQNYYCCSCEKELYHWEVKSHCYSCICCSNV